MLMAMQGKRDGATAEQGQMADETAALIERAASARGGANDAQAGFGPGVAWPGVRGLAGREGMPRQWAYGASYNVAQCPRGTEKTTFVQLRIFAALYEGIQPACYHTSADTGSPIAQGGRCQQRSYELSVGQRELADHLADHLDDRPERLLNLSHGVSEQ
jgi:hypothetical protein